MKNDNIKKMLIDFSSVDQKDFDEKKSRSKVPPSTGQKDSLKRYTHDFDDTTTSYYKSYRLNKMDPITDEILQDDSCFKFRYMWNPYTGERLGEDPFGPLCFNPINLLRHFYLMRLNKLWVDGEEGYEGYFSGGVGSGPNLDDPSRGMFPECYLFRLPIQNCYLNKNHNLSIITMGPLLTLREICELDRLIVKYWSRGTFYKKYYKKIGSLYKLKCYYDIALAKNPIDMDLSGIDVGTREEALKQKNPNLYLNLKAINAMKNMK
jgi:hypothetical protein